MKRFLRIFSVLLCTALLLSLAGLLYAASSWGYYDPNKLEKHTAASRFYDAQGNQIEASILSQWSPPVSLDNLPNYVYQAFLAAEDQQFFNHFGINPKRILSALIYDIRTHSRAHGASTITQQLVKLTHLTSEKTFTRKLQEAYYAVLIERDYTKEQILQFYLDTVYFGAGAYGLEAAARTYFGCEAKELSAGQAACLAAILKAPSYYAPHLDPQANEERRQYVIDEMESLSFLSPDEARQARMEKIVIQKDAADQAADWFVDQALIQASSLLGKTYGQILTGNYRIFTTLDSALQRTALALAENAALFPENAPDGEAVQCALIAMEKNGAVRACIGGRSYEAQLGLNRAVDAKRQPGSVLKPLAVYAPAFEEKRITAATVLLDEPMDFDGYQPSNYAGTYYGPVTVRTALAKSLNLPAVQLMAQNGAADACAYLNRFGIPTSGSDAYLPLAVGSMSEGVTPQDLCGAYLTFLNDGMRPNSYWIESIYDENNALIYRHQDQTQRVLSPDTCALVTSLMQSAAQEGTARALTQWGYPVAAKTGTVGYESGGNRDAWSVALTPNHVFVAWLGFDETTAQTHLDDSVTGSRYPIPLLLQWLTQAYPNGDGDAFSLPSSIVTRQLDAWTLEQTGQLCLATAITPPEFTMTELFSSSNVPAQESPYWQIPEPPEDLHVEEDQVNRVRITFTANDPRARYRLYRQSGIVRTQIGECTGSPGTLAVFHDSGLQWLRPTTYFVIAEHAAAAEAGIENAWAQSTPVSYQMPFFSFFGRDIVDGLQNRIEDDPNPLGLAE